MFLSQLFLQWGKVILEIGRHQGAEAAFEKGRQEGFRTASRPFLEAKFGEEGLKFWEDSIEPYRLAGWEFVMFLIKRAKTLDDLVFVKELRY